MKRVMVIETRDKLAEGAALPESLSVERPAHNGYLVGSNPAGTIGGSAVRRDRAAGKLRAFLRPLASYGSADLGIIIRSGNSAGRVAI